MLWKRRVELEFDEAKPNSRYPKDGMPCEAIVGVQTVDDLNDDSLADLVINCALFDPAGFSRPFIVTLSGRDGVEIARAEFPTIDMSKINHWPWAGLLRHLRPDFVIRQNS